MSPDLTHAALVLVLTLGLTASCSKKPDNPPVTQQDGGIGDAGLPDAGDGSDGGEDAGQVDAGPAPCTFDDDCAPNERCDSEKGFCIPGDECQNVPGEEHVTCRTLSYCDKTTGLGCRCVKAEGATAPNNGFCKRRLPPCAPCETDEQCGDDLFFQNDLYEPGKCVQTPEGKFCLQSFRDSKCGCGRALAVDGQSYCYPQEPGTCLEGTFSCCEENADCPGAHPICDQASGRCRDACTYDFAEEETVGCRSDLVCHVDPIFLDPRSPNYGAGRCGPPCASNADCALVGTGFVCQAERNSQPRCRPPGCLNDMECEDEDPESPYLSYCERSSGECRCEGVPDNQCHCRTAPEGGCATNPDSPGCDPLTGNAYVDCKADYKCEQDTCLKKNCVELGGADLAGCGIDGFCCGEDRNGNGTIDDDPCINAAGISLASYGECYQAPRPPWCASCESDADCVGNGAPTSTKDPNLCLDFGNGPACLYACELRTQCPIGYSCATIPVYCTLGADPGECGNVSRCVQTGVDPSTNPPTPIAQCTCTSAGTVGGECPDTNRCDDGGRFCIMTQACIPWSEEVCQ